jgi:hypothetical protein
MFWWLPVVVGDQFDIGFLVVCQERSHLLVGCAGLGG